MPRYCECGCIVKMELSVIKEQVMRIFSRLIILSLLVTLFGCAVNGKHIYAADGKCLSCWNNPLSGKPINHDGTSSFSGNSSKSSLANFSLAKSVGAQAVTKDRFSSADQLVFLYHDTGHLQYPKVEHLIREFSKGNGELRMLADRYNKERNAFNKNDVLNRINNVLDNRTRKVGNITFFDRVYFSQYDFEKESYDVCFNSNCKAIPEQYTEKFGAIRYQLRANNVSNKFQLDVGKSQARELETLAAKGTGFNFRAVPVLITVKPAGVDQSKKWSDGTPFRVLEAEIISVHLLNEWPKSRSNMPAISTITHKIVSM